MKQQKLLKHEKLRLKNVIIPDPQKLEKIKEHFKKEGNQKLHVLTDFDNTLTRAFVDGKRVPSLISVLRDSNYLGHEYAEKANALYRKYHAIETDPTISKKERKKAMHEWWSIHFNLLIKSGLNRKDIEKVVKSRKIKFRQGALEFIDFLHKQNIPLIIMSSSGLGEDAIAMYLKKENRLYNNIYIISNKYEWDQNGNAIGVKQPIIHSMNKDETMIQNFPVFDVVKNKKNVLLLGNNIGDVGMIEGFNYDNLIKIGFLNEKIEENLEEFKKNFDIIITNDSGMDYINQLLRELFE